MIQNSETNKNRPALIGFLSCVVLLLISTLIGLSILNSKINKNYSAQNDKRLIELLDQINDNYQIVIAPENATETYIDSINAAKNERSVFIEKAIIKETSDLISKSSVNIASTIQYGNKLLFVWGTILAIIVIFFIYYCYSILKKQLTISLNNISANGNSYSMLDDISNTEHQNTDNKPITSTPEALIENNANSEDSLTNINTTENLTVNENNVPIFISKDLVSEVEALEVEEIIEEANSNIVIEKENTALTQNQPSNNHDEEIDNILEIVDNLEKIRSLDNRLLLIKEDDSISLKRQKTLLFKTNFYLAQAYQLNNEPKKAISIYTDLINQSPQQVRIFLERANAYKLIEEYDLALNDYDKALSLKPESDEAFFNRGIINLEINKYQDAINDFNLFLKLNQNDAIALFSRGKAYQALNDINKALNDYNTAIAIDPGYEDAYNKRGEIFFSLGEDLKALNDFDSIIKLSPDNSNAYNKKGLLYINLSSYKEAVTEFSKALELSPLNEELYRNRGNAHAYLSQFDDAIDDYNEVLSLNSDFPDIYICRANAYFNQKEYLKAIADYDIAIERSSNNSELYFKRGVSYYYTEKYDEAIADFNQAILLSPDDIDIIKFRSYSYIKIGQQDKASQDYLHLINEGQANADIYFNLATIDFDKNDFSTAILNFDKSIDLDNNNTQAYFMRGMSLCYLKEYEKAIADFSDSLKLSPNNSDVYYNRGNAYTNIKKFDSAISDYSEAIKLNPSIAEAYFNRGNILYNHTQYTAAIQDYSMAITINPSYTKAYFNRGLAYKTTEQFKNGVDDFEKILSLDTNDYRLIEKSQKQIEILTKLLRVHQENQSANLEGLDI